MAHSGLECRIAPERSVLVSALNAVLSVNTQAPTASITVQTITLDGTWRFKAVRTGASIPKEHRSALRWLEAAVPGTVHTDLRANGIIPDPSHRMNELGV